MIYNYKSDKLTQEVLIECLCPLCEDLIDEYSTLRRYENLSIYAPSWLVREIIGRLLDEIEDLWVDTDSENELLYEDDNEVLVTIGYDGMIFVEDARVNDVIKSNEDCSLTYIYDGFGKKDVDILEVNGESILVFGFEDEDEVCDEDGDELAIESDGDMHGFSVNHYDENGYSSYSFYSTNLNLVNEMAKFFR